MIIPSIDIMDGKAVQLVQGKKKVLERKGLIKLAKEFRRYGEIAVIDLDAAMGKGDNSNAIKKLCSVAECRVGGGIRTVEKARAFLKAGAKKIIIGTMANREFLKQLPKERVIVAVDSKEGFVVDKGWKRKTKKKPQELVREVEGYCSEFLYTIVDKEGMLKGTDIHAIKELKNLTKNKITAAGGISSIEEITLLEDIGVNSQIGMAIYTNKISLAGVFASLIDFKKGGGTVPTIVKDEMGQILMLAYSTKESLVQALKTGKAAYFSRSRKKLWVKGESSGNSQELMSARFDCDRDVVLFTVKQKGVACHLGGYSCFGDKEIIIIEELYKIVKSRIECPVKESYTSEISKDEERLFKKIIEEAFEVAISRNKKEAIFEVADLFYFITILLAKRGVTYKEVFDELAGRMR